MHQNVPQHGRVTGYFRGNVYRRPQQPEQTGRTEPADTVDRQRTIGGHRAACRAQLAGEPEIHKEKPYRCGQNACQPQYWQNGNPFRSSSCAGSGGRRPGNCCAAGLHPDGLPGNDGLYTAGTGKIHHTAACGQEKGSSSRSAANPHRLY